MTEPVATGTAVPADADISAIVDALCHLDRLRDIAEIDTRSPELHRRIHDLTDRTQDRLGLPISLVTLVLDSAQLVLSASGLDGWIVASNGTPIEWSFCSRAAASHDTYVVTDTHSDPIQQHNPLVTIDGIGAYAGVPLMSRTGHIVGVHCVIDTQAHEFSAAELAELRRTGDEIAAILDEYRSRTSAVDAA